MIWAYELINCIYCSVLNHLFGLELNQYSWYKLAWIAFEKRSFAALLIKGHKWIHFAFMAHYVSNIKKSFDEKITEMFLPSSQTGIMWIEHFSKRRWSNNFTLFFLIQSLSSCFSPHYFCFRIDIWLFQTNRGKI